MKIDVIPLLNLSKDGATSQLLILDEKMYILFDCGVDKNFNFSAYRDNFEKYINHVDIIFLSHTAMEFTGALPFILKNL